MSLCLKIRYLRWSAASGWSVSLWAWVSYDFVRVLVAMFDQLFNDEEKGTISLNLGSS